jgi:hypothetical protein
MQFLTDWLGDKPTAHSLVNLFYYQKITCYYKLPL